MGAPETDSGKGQRPRWRRWLRRAGITYLVLVVATHLLMAATVAVARALGEDPRRHTEGISNFRIVDDSMWAGGQPDADAYAALAAEGVRLVVDLRTGAADDPRRADPDQLRAMGVDYLDIPIGDGHVPSPSQVDQLVEAARDADGVVFVHCGGGVGRSSTMTAAYRALHDTKPSAADQLAIGPHTLAQAWFVTTGDRNPVVSRVSEALDAPRRLWSRIRGLA